ncbi:type II toxin-antitoxin system VapB family antitoxin [Candidatus Halobeggiatoa sp. HSG11]|nr:type II toxin-antitoxin system VapB family antitoxin [Candidatus Halobeggiatoa sp. HSG11]
MDDELIKETMNLSQKNSKKEAILTALKEYINYKKRMEVTNIFGIVDYDSDYDYKEQRKISFPNSSLGTHCQEAPLRH